MAHAIHFHAIMMMVHHMTIMLLRLWPGIIFAMGFLPARHSLCIMCMDSIWSVDGSINRHLASFFKHQSHFQPPADFKVFFNILQTDVARTGSQGDLLFWGKRNSRLRFSVSHNGRLPELL